jgi:hypothetical protein
MEPQQVDEIDYLRPREEQAAELLEWWFNLANNVLGAPKQETLEWLANLKPWPEEKR